MPCDRLLDGHVLLDRELAARGHYPPISILNSLSRLMPAVCSEEHRNRGSGIAVTVGAVRALGGPGSNWGISEG